MATTKRAYKLQEFVAHTSDVNCLKIGRKTSRLLVTGGEDQKVNLWSIGKPNALLSLSGHTSPVESVCFDSSEVLVAAGAVSGTTKLWDLEEAKVVRSLTGHRSNCISIDFHPFGEFLASGSSDTNLKIWDVRRKACIHTYKGHNRGINAVRFTPDGRWVVSGGEDNIVKLWDLTAGKLLHDFKCHEGQIQCIDFHPHEFLLATGSADKTVKFWDLETFELIGSSGPEASGICYMTFNSYGRTLLCGLHKSLQVLSWEPIRYHDVVDMGWSRLSDLNVHDGKLLGCSYNQSCVGIWVVDILIEPYAITSAVQSDVSSAQKSNTINNLSHQTDNKIDSSKRRSLDSQNSELVTRIMNRFPSSGNLPGITQRVGSTGLKTASANLAPAPATTMSKRSSPRTLRTTNIQNLNRLEVVPVAVPRSSPGANFVDDLKEDTVDVVPFICRTSPRVTLPTDARKGICDAVSVHALRTSSMVDEFIDSRRETAAGKPPAYVVQSKLTDYRKITNRRDHLEKVNFTFQTGLVVNNKTEFSKVVDRSTFFPINGVRASSNVLFGCLANKGLEHSEVVDHNTLSTANGANELESSAESSKEPAKFGASIPMEPSQRHFHDKNDARIEKAKDSCKMDKANGGRTKSLVASWESREHPIYECPRTSNFSEAKYAANVTISLRQYATSSGKEAVSARDEDDVSYLMKQHEQFLTSTLSRLTKLQVVRRLWKRNDVKGAMSAVEKMSDHAISADVVSILLEKSDIVTLDKCACLLPLLTSLVESRTDRFVDISLEMLLKLVKKYGLVIHSALSAVPSTGVDLHAEQRLEHCKMCLIELEKIKYCIPSLKRRRGSIANSVQELSLLLQDVFSVTS